MKEKPTEVLHEHQLIDGFRKILGEFTNDIKMLRQPLAHGATSENLESILAKGFGIELPTSVFDGSLSMTDVTKPDGLLGAYTFARMHPDELMIRSEDIDGADVIARYVTKNPLISETSLREAVAQYKKIKQPSGFPVLMIFEGEGIKFRYVNPRVPSEVELDGPPKDTHPVIMLVQQNRMSEVATMLKRYDVSAKMYPIEILELD